MILENKQKLLRGPIYVNNGDVAVPYVGLNSISAEHALREGEASLPVVLSDDGCKFRALVSGAIESRTDGGISMAVSRVDWLMIVRHSSSRKLIAWY